MSSTRDDTTAENQRVDLGALCLGSYAVHDLNKRICTPREAAALDIVNPGLRLAWAVDTEIEYITVGPDAKYFADHDRYEFYDDLKVYESDRVAEIPGDLVGDQVTDQVPDHVDLSGLDYETRPMSKGQRFYFVTTGRMLDDSGGGAKKMWLLDRDQFNQFVDPRYSIEVDPDLLAS